MGGEWTVTDFADAIDFQEGPGILAKDFHSHGVPLVRLSGLDRGVSLLAGCNYLDPELVAKKWAHFALQKGDILLSTSASLGRIAVVEDEGVGAIAYTGIIRMRPRDERLAAPFIRYLLEGPNFQQQAEAFGAGSVIRHFGPMHLRQMNVLLPPAAEQRAIAHILGTLDDKIELNRRRNQTLEAMARALFKDWFIDFGPVRRNAAKAQNQPSPGLRPPSPRGRGFENTTHEHLPSPPGRGAGGEGVIEGQTFDHLFPDRLDDEGKPEGWEMRRISDYLGLAYGKSLPAGKRHQGDIPVYGSGGITGLHSEALINGPAIIVGRKGTVGSLYWEDRPCFPIDTVFFVQPKAPLPFCYYLLESLPLRDMNTDAAVPGLNRENVYRLEIAAPSNELISAFAETAARFRASIAAVSREGETLAQLRDTLLPRLISGEMLIMDTERFMEGVHA